MSKDLEKLVKKTYALVSELNQKVDYLIESRKEFFFQTEGRDYEDHGSGE